MKAFAVVMMILGIVIFWIGLHGSQHAVMAMLRGNPSIQPSGLPLNPSGPGIQNPQLSQYQAYTSGGNTGNQQVM